MCKKINILYKRESLLFEVPPKNILFVASNCPFFWKCMQVEVIHSISDLPPNFV